MIRLRAVRTMLFDDVAELRLERGRWTGRSAPSRDPGERPADLREATEDDGDREAIQRSAIVGARSRAALVAGFDLVALLVLFAFRRQAAPFLVLGGSEEGLFTLGVLAIAVHAGYRLGQRQKLGAVLRAWDTLPGRYDKESVGRSV